MNSPSSRSLAPSPYMLAVSMKLPPALAKPSKMPRLSSALDPNERGSPKVMAPKHSSETRSPLAPNVMCFMNRGPSLLASSCERSESGWQYERKLNNSRQRARSIANFRGGRGAAQLHGRSAPLAAVHFGRKPSHRPPGNGARCDPVESHDAQRERHRRRLPLAGGSGTGAACRERSAGQRQDRAAGALGLAATQRASRCLPRRPAVAARRVRTSSPRSARRGRGGGSSSGHRERAIRRRHSSTGLDSQRHDRGAAHAADSLRRG